MQLKKQYTSTHGAACCSERAAVSWVALFAIALIMLPLAILAGCAQSASSSSAEASGSSGASEESAGSSSDGLSTSQSFSAASVSASEAGQAKDETVIVTPAYTITIPEELKTKCSYEMVVGAPESPTMQTGIAWHVRVFYDSLYYFDVTAFSDDWGIQGDFNYANLGPSSSYPGWNVFVYRPRDYGGVDDVRGWVSTAGGDPAQSNAIEAGNSPGDYVLSDSGTKAYSRAELEALSTHDLFIARNEIYARHGRIFQNQELRDYFEAKRWYRAIVQPDDFNDSVLNDAERANANLMLEIEKERNSPYLS